MARIFSRLRLPQKVFAKEGVLDCGNPLNFTRKRGIASLPTVVREDESRGLCLCEGGRARLWQSPEFPTKKVRSPHAS